MTTTNTKINETREQLTNALKRLAQADRPSLSQTVKRDLLEMVALDAKLALAALDEPIDENVIDRATIVRVYSGKPGCGCGCRGNYSTNPATITRVVNKMNARSEEVVLSSGIYALEDDERYNWAYTYDSIGQNVDESSSR